MIKPPRKLNEYLPVEAAANSLKSLAGKLLEDRDARPLIRYSITLHFWNPAWLEPSTKNAVICTSVTKKTRK